MTVPGLRWLAWLRAEVRRAAATARRAVQLTRPNSGIDSTELRAEETERLIFAVFYSTPGQHQRPAAYELVAVSRGAESSEILEGPAASPYAFRGRK